MPTETCRGLRTGRKTSGEFEFELSSRKDREDIKDRVNCSRGRCNVVCLGSVGWWLQGKEQRSVHWLVANRFEVVEL